MKFFIYAIAACAALFVHAAQAQVNVTEPWVRATVAQQRTTGAFMQLSAAKRSKLVAVSSPVAAVVEIHEMAVVDNMMRMRQVSAIDLPAGQSVELGPDGYHVMLIDLKRQIKVGEKVPLVLVFEDAAGKRATQQVSAEVRALNAPVKPAGQAMRPAH